nr:hypothetical protein [uncultured Arsenicibacter sp.]
MGAGEVINRTGCHLSRDDPESGWISGSTLRIESVQKKDAEKWSQWTWTET